MLGNTAGWNEDAVSEPFTEPIPVTYPKPVAVGLTSVERLSPSDVPSVPGTSQEPNPASESSAKMWVTVAFASPTYPGSPTAEYRATEDPSPKHGLASTNQTAVPDTRPSSPPSSERESRTVELGKVPRNAVRFGRLWTACGESSISPGGARVPARPAPRQWDSGGVVPRI